MSPVPPGPPVLVTGGAGFIGSHLVAALLGSGREVVVLDDFDDFYDPSLKRKNIAALAAPGLRVVEGDIRDTALVDRVFADGRFHSVIHLAARAGVRPSIEQAALYTSVNLDGTTCLLEAARRHGVERFVFGSSSSVYGNNPKVPFAEDDPVDHPVSPYAATKKAGELLCYSHHHLYGLHVACLRFFTVYGPRQRPEMAIHKFTRLLWQGKDVEQYGDGTSARDYTYVSDIVDGILRAWERCRGYRVYNLGGSRTVTLSDLLAKIAQRLGVPKRVRAMPAQPGDVERTWADVSRARQELGWEPKVDLDSGLDLFVDWFRREGAEVTR
ncbi:MAG TPA: GDP-mannose 4,6-dehydratase [Candidatus Polarisedimenticolaceae bacterium]|nr:GDP-mannose 4,6-dehydratase [Candidatus Polarisedimenticolaceae bacterium]